MVTDTHAATVSTAGLWAGRIITALTVLFLTFDGVNKIIKTAPVVKASEQLGLPPNTILGIGIVASLYCNLCGAANGCSRRDPADWISGRRHRDPRPGSKRSVSDRLLYRLRRAGLGRTRTARTAAVVDDSAEAVTRVGTAISGSKAPGCRNVPRSSAGFSSSTVIRLALAKVS